MKKIAVVILNYNSADDCSKCVGFLTRQEGVEQEIVIVDNNSRPEEARVVEALCREKGLTFIAADSNRGYNAGNNIGLRYAAEKGYENALIANPDMEFPDPHYIERLLLELESRPETVAIGSDIITPEGIHQNPKLKEEEDWRNCFNWLKDLFFKQEQYKDIPSWVDQPDKSRECRCLNGCCLMVKMDYMKEIGFFDERTFLYGEEPIFGRTVELSGKKMYYFADVTAIHDHKKSREGASNFCRKHWKHSQILYIRHYSMQPFYGRWLAELSSRIYFAILGIYHALRLK